MADARCSCGFTETGDEQITDHLLELFAPEDGMGNDGLVHFEGTTGLACLCGLAASTTEELDSHFLDVFTQADSIGRDGIRHERLAA